tara:strand:+ start:520 stop:804 length:285 start_codon:yes stop_codon:yes gene_type:complete
MKLNAKQKEIVKKLVKGNGQFKTSQIPKEKFEKNLEDIVSLYLKGILTFQREYDVDWVGPSNEHKVRFKWYVITIDKKKTIKDIKNVMKEGKVA